METIEEVDNNENETDIITLQRRLQKAIRLADKLKQKYEFEREVSRELAKRNELLKAELNFEEENYRNLSNVFKETCARFGDLLTYQGCFFIFIR